MNQQKKLNTSKRGIAQWLPDRDVAVAATATSQSLLKTASLIEWKGIEIVAILKEQVKVAV